MWNGSSFIEKCCGKKAIQAQKDKRYGNCQRDGKSPLRALIKDISNMFSPLMKLLDHQQKFCRGNAKKDNVQK